MIKLQQKIHKNTVARGRWNAGMSVTEVLCLIHSEAARALATDRNDDMENFKMELANVAIMLLDIAEGYGIDLQKEILKIV